ncbi:ribonuclease H-like domain-containing protein, partial [Tanacetum coccineum]
DGERDAKGYQHRKRQVELAWLYNQDLGYGYLGDTECLVLSSNFKLLDESQVLLRVLRKDNIYSVDLKSVIPTKGLTCLFVKATIDESNLWHRRLGHINFKNMNKLVRGNLVRGLPSKIFENDHSCVACQKGKQHKASCKAKLVNWKRISEKRTKNEAKNDKTEHEMEKRQKTKSKSQSQPKGQPSQN